MSLFHDLPIDLVREIMEIAAGAGPSGETSTSLSLVSHEVQSWTDQYLFQNLVQKSYESSLRNFFASFLSERASDRFKRARLYVLRFATQRSYDPDNYVEKLIALCPNLTSLALWAMDLPSEFENPSSSLPNFRRLSFSAVRGGTSQLSFRSPAFLNITHMDLGGWDSYELPTIWNAGVDALISLTHLLLNGSSANAGERPDLISHYLCGMPPSLRILVIIVMEAALDDIPNEYYDRKVVFLVEEVGPCSPVGEIRENVNGHRAFPMWSGDVDEGDTYWFKAESIVEARNILKCAVP